MSNSNNSTAISFKQEATLPATAPEASVLARAIALGIDYGILACLEIWPAVFVNRMTAVFTNSDHFLFSAVHLLQALGFTLWLAILPPAYFTIFHACGGQTPGKLAMGIAVVSLNGQQLSGGTTFLRSIGYICSAIPLAGGFLWAMVDKNHRTWHDKLASTRVVARTNDLTKN